MSDLSFTHLTPSELADAYAIAKAEADAAVAKLEALKKAVDKTGFDKLVGATFTLKVNIFERSQFDAKTAKAFLTPEQVAESTKLVDVRVIKVAATAPSLVIAA